MGHAGGGLALGATAFGMVFRPAADAVDCGDYGLNGFAHDFWLCVGDAGAAAAVPPVFRLPQHARRVGLGLGGGDCAAGAICR